MMFNDIILIILLSEIANSFIFAMENLFNSLADSTLEFGTFYPFQVYIHISITIYMPDKLKLFTGIYTQVAFLFLKKEKYLNGTARITSVNETK